MFGCDGQISVSPHQLIKRSLLFSSHENGLGTKRLPSCAAAGSGALALRSHYSLSSMDFLRKKESGGCGRTTIPALLRHRGSAGG